MDMDSNVQPVCAKCGHAVSGKFCSECGHRASASPNVGAAEIAEGWTNISSEFLSSPGSNGLFSVGWSFLRAPVDTIIRLTEDPLYRSHWGFLTACLGAQLTLAYVILPRLYTTLFATPDIANSSAVITNEVVQYIGMAVLIPAQYYICRALGTRRRTPMSYVKFCALSVSFGAIVSTISSLAFFLAGIYALRTGADIGIRQIGTALTAATLGTVLIFVALSHRRFWGLSWPAAIGFTIAVAVLSWVVVYPALTALAERANIPGTLGYLFG